MSHTTKYSSSISLHLLAGILGERWGVGYDLAVRLSIGEFQLLICIVLHSFNHLFWFCIEIYWNSSANGI